MRFVNFAFIAMAIEVPLVVGDFLRTHRHRTLYDTNAEIRQKKTNNMNLDSLFLEDDTQWRRMLDAHLSMDTIVSLSMPARK
mmetsp:Transcript_10654/g.16314  ORF Transcript_10654/g.16314 Transcript_10654/m.16314 type:complete len:82 (+) Transcript_10654:154-399(+)